MAGKITSRPENIPDTPWGAAVNLQSHENRKLRLRKAKRRVRFYSMFIGVIVVLAGYFMLPISKVSAVAVSGMHNLNSDYIVGISGLTSQSRYYLTIPYLVERKITEDPLIESAQVSLEAANTIRIQIKEKKAIGYRYEDEPVILLVDNTKAPLKSEYLEMIANLPLITGFESGEQTRLLAKAFEDVNLETIEDISEITQYALHYDDESLKVLMRNGGYFVANYYNFATINQFNTIYSHLKDRSSCIFAPEESNYAYAKACPWNEDQSDKEYWLDENGEILHNRFGDPVFKRYYNDREGMPALDENGNKIPIPVDENGNLLRDPDFILNYEAGYYSTGILSFDDE